MCLTLLWPHGISQARILEWVAISFSRGSSQCRDWTQISCIAGRFFTIWISREAPKGRAGPSRTKPWAGVRSSWGQESIFLVWALWETLFGNLSKSYHFLDFSFHFCQIGKFYLSFMRALVTQTVKNTPAEQEIWVQSLGQEDPLKKGMATHSSILAWRMPWTEESAGLLSRGSQRVGHDWVTNTHPSFLSQWVWEAEERK